MRPFRLPSDVGGTRTGESVDRAERGHAAWELLGAGVRMALIAKGLLRWDEGRRAVEELGAERYERLTYEERKTAALAALLVEKGVLTPDELNPELDVPPSSPAARRSIVAEASRRAHSVLGAAPCSEGDRVRIRDDWPPGHLRTPGYLRGKEGCVLGVHGPFPNPELLAYGEPGLPALRVCTVEFPLAAVWEDYSGSPRDVVRADIYEQWIEPVKAAP